MFIFFDCGTENETSQEFNFTSMVRSTMDFAMFLALFSTNLKNEIVHIIPYNWFYIVYQVSYFLLMGLSDIDFVFFFFFFFVHPEISYIYTRVFVLCLFCLFFCCYIFLPRLPLDLYSFLHVIF